jgi:hypothetical protein
MEKQIQEFGILIYQFVGKCQVLEGTHGGKCQMKRKRDS